MRFLTTLAIALTTGLVLVACSESASTIAELHVDSSAVSSSQRTNAPSIALPERLGPRKQHLYVVNSGSNEVTTYDTNGKQTHLLAAGRFTDPEGVAVDVSGRIYVTNSGSNAISVFSKNGKPLRSKIDVGLLLPFGVAVDANGKIYVTNYDDGTMTSYTRDGRETTPTLEGFGRPIGVAIDTNGKIYVVDNLAAAIFTFTPDGQPSSPTITAGLFFAEFVAVDSVGTIHVSSCEPGTVTTYKPDGTETKPTISLPSGQCPAGLAVDENGKIYIANPTTDSIEMYPKEGVPAGTITAGISTPTALAIH
jgi:YVTN family beta-propeller protein